MSILDVKFVSVPSKRLKKALSASSDRLVLNNIRNWENESGEAIDLTPENFGDTQYVVLRDKNNTRLEIIEIDPSTIADSEITILKRGLQFDGDLVEEPTLKQAWEVSGTIVELGTHTPQALESLLRLTKQNDFTIIPRTFEVDGETPAIADEDAQVVNKGQLDTAISEIDDDKVSKSGDTMTGALNMGTHKVTNVADSTDDGDAVNRGQLNDAIFAGALPASETQMGLVEIATDAQIEEGTDVGETGAPLVVVPSKVPTIDWNLNKGYDINDIVNYDGKIYKSVLTPNVNKNPLTAFDPAPFDFTKLCLTKTGQITGLDEMGKFYNDGLIFVNLSDVMVLTIYVLNTAYDVSDVASSTTLDIRISTNITLAFDMSSDGTKLVVATDGGTNTDFYIFTLSTAFDATTATQTSSQLNPVLDDVVDLQIKSSTEFYFLYDLSATERLYKYTMPSAWSLPGFSLTIEFNLDAATEGTLQSFGFVDGGNKFWFAGSLNDNIWYIDLDAPYDFTGKLATDAVQITEITNTSGKFQISDDMTHVSVVQPGATGSVTTHALGDAYWTNTTITTFGQPVPIIGTSGVTNTAPSSGFWFGKYSDGTSSTTSLSINMVMSGVSISMSVSERNSFCFPCNAGDTITFSHSWTVIAYFRPIT